MAVRSTTAHALADRARKAGWAVTKIDDGYRVAMDKGRCDREGCTHLAYVHLTASDQNAERVILRNMTMHGLTAAEKRAERKRDKDRTAAIAASRAAAERKAAALLKQAKAANRAAGPYAGPELVDDAWFLNPHPAPTFKWVIMTPEQAQRILDRINLKNRPLRWADVHKYAGIILSNQWHLTHQGGAIDEDGILQDGQHRLLAIVKAGIAVAMPWFCGMSRENFKHIDEGRARTAAQLFGRDSEEYAPVVLQGLNKLIMALQSDNPRREWRRDRTNQEIYDALGADADELRTAASFAGRYAKRAGCGPVGLAGAYYMIRKANGVDSPYVAAFFRGYVNGRKSDDVGLHPDDPRLRLREYTANLKTARKRLSSIGGYSLTVRAWNYVLAGKKVNNMRWSDKDMDVPRIDVIKADPRGVAYGCPELLHGEVSEPEPVADTGDLGTFLQSAA